MNRVILSALVLPGALAWDRDGHAAIVDAAKDYFNSNANKTVIELMGKDVRIADYSSLPDSVLHGPHAAEWEWSAGLHYADTDDKCNFVYSRDCKDDYCVVGAIKNFTRQVANISLPQEQRQEAFIFLMHFMGDIHQPLHLGRAEDVGGNLIHVNMKFADFENGNLHSVWDSKMIDQLEGSEFGPGYIQQNFNYSTPPADRDMFWTLTEADVRAELVEGGAFHDKIPGWLEDCEKNGLDVCVNDMAVETAAVACSVAYRHTNGDEIEDGDVLPMEYYNERIEIVKEQLAKAIVRFAWVMNNAFPEDTPVTTTSTPTDCTEADKKCELSYPGSYCKYWQTIPVCFGSNVPCSC
ncbi:conserved hypothetical protein [Perkinsus marinus ATCC 50983]|uniref:Nuclease S1 n=1 Tax=Perkinsus marinus (strain ATCC 50983 / TXsc) TaxID=423536 RepID=C5K476_PERM5|nr:conserved hypothetical protein [Perkinsus marinus ATCC 50983]EER20692.1 conserved hypothetical protein [Perkinsus marinus ATCC 50983]|eukprot:XP_002788896.1 conserved hypothetical protein [Perkinsus marinus ATCC 50983]